MAGEGTAPKDSTSTSKKSLLPGILAALAMLLYAGMQVIGMLAYNWNGHSTVIMLALGAFVYFGTMGFQQWNASGG